MKEEGLRYKGVSQRHALIFWIGDYPATTLSSTLYCLDSKLLVIITVRYEDTDMIGSLYFSNHYLESYLFTLVFLRLLSLPSECKFHFGYFHCLPAFI